MKKNTALQQTELDNGIRIVTERMPYRRSVSIGVWVQAGIINETAANNGISHLLEHMLFKGTHNRSGEEIAKSLEMNGGTLNGSTGKEASIYTAHVLDENTELAVDVLADLIQNPKLDEEDLAREKNVVLAEINQSKEDPEEYLFDHFYQSIFPDHPLGYFIHGNESNVAALGTVHLQQYLDLYYTPDRLVFSVAGNIDHSRFVDLISRSIVKTPRQTPKPVYPVNSKVDRYKVIELDGVLQAHICLGCRSIGITDNHRYELTLIDMLLGGGMSSRLFQNIREKYGFAYTVYSFVEFMQSTGVFGVYMACSVDHLEQSIELLHNEFKQLATVPVSQDELNQIKSQARGNILLGMESSSRRMRFNGENEFYQNPPLEIRQILEKINNITTDDVLQVTNELFDKRNLCIAVIIPPKD